MHCSCDTSDDTEAVGLETIIKLRLMIRLSGSVVTTTSALLVRNAELMFTIQVTCS